MHLVLGGLAGAIVLFIVDGILQRVPLVMLTRKEFESYKGVKNLGKEDRPLIQKIVIMLIEGYLFAFAYFMIRAGLSQNTIVATLQFWFVLTAVRIIPEAMEFWHETYYPAPLIWLESGMDVVTSLAAAFTYAYIIT